MPNLASLLYGRPDSPPAPVPLRAGPLQLLFDPASGFVRRIRLGEREVLRGIYAAVRDRNWDTIPGALVETRREITADAFHLEFECRHRLRDIDFVWRGTLTGESDGLLRYTFEGEALSTFHRNRIGFCVLHPIRECAGAAALQTRIDGSRVECRFPDAIERQIFGQNSFHDLQAVAHEVEPGVWAEVSFDGDVFETEDQRNWTDASFKTYCTPLALPFPVEVPAGTHIRQCVTLRLEGGGTTTPGRGVELADRMAAPVRVAPSGGPAAPMPRLGVGLASHDRPLTERQAARLRALGLSHLRVDLRLSSVEWPRLWERALREAEQIGVSLELALHAPRDGNVDGSAVRRQLAAGAPRVIRALALREGEAATTPQTLEEVRRVVEGWNVPVGVGSDANFCELNREQALGRCAPAGADFVFWSINPQVHAFDDTSVMETLEAQSATIRSARAFAGGKPLVVSPVTLRQRYNPVATGPEPLPAPGQLPRQVDPRQAGLFGAAWTLGSVVELANAGAASLTYFETTGWRGLVELGEGPPLPAEFPSIPGAALPPYHVFAELGGFLGGEILPVKSSDPGAVTAFALRRGQRQILLLGNLGPEPRAVDLDAFPDLGWMRCLTADNLRDAGAAPGGVHSATGQRPTSILPLPPFSLGCLLNTP